MKSLITTAFCQINCSTASSCCNGEVVVDADLDRDMDGFTKEFPSHEGQEDCDCPGCHLQVIPTVKEIAPEISPMYFTTIFLWKDRQDEACVHSVFHPPCC